jgi:hypothetical protein
MIGAQPMRAAWDCGRIDLRSVAIERGAVCGAVKSNTKQITTCNLENKLLS